ncbi:MAG: hypothetical protein R2766_02600 [Saprospiraceae bacterium]
MSGYALICDDSSTPGDASDDFIIVNIVADNPGALNQYRVEVRPSGGGSILYSSELDKKHTQPITITGGGSYARFSITGRWTIIMVD